MMKKRTRILLSVFSVLVLLVFVTASPRARSNPNPTSPVLFEIKGQIRWKKALGLIPIGPGKILASNSACSPFFIVVYEYNKNFDSSDLSKIIAHSSRSTSQPTEQEEYYVCDYSIQVPPDKSMFVRAGMGDVDLLPKMSREPYYLTDPWIRGTNSRPPAGWERGFRTLPEGSNNYLEFPRFEMVYVHSPDASSTSEKGPSPLLPALNFAGAWRAKFGESSLELILQQSGKQVTGELRGFAYRVVVREGRVVGNTLRFQIRRVDPTKVLGNPNFEEPMGTGELVMGEGGKSFTGTLLGTATSGTLLGR